MSAPLQQFTYLGQTVIIRPGSKFSKNELNSRLHQMGVQYDQSSLSKKYFQDLYENALKYDSNKVKIFDRLIKDTINFNNIKGNQRINIIQSKIETPNTNNSKVAIIENKIINQDMLRNNRYSTNINNSKDNSQNIILTKNKQSEISYGNDSNNYRVNNYNNLSAQSQNSINLNKENQMKNYYENNSPNSAQYTFKESLVNEIKKNQNMINNNQQNENNFFEKYKYNNNTKGADQSQNYEHNKNISYNQQNILRNIPENSQNYNYQNNYSNNNYQNNYNKNQSQNNYNQQSNNFDQAQRNYLQNQSQQNIKNMNQSGYINQSQINQNYQNQSQRINMDQNNNNKPQQSYYNNNLNKWNNNSINSNNMKPSNNNIQNSYERKNCIINENEENQNYINYSNNYNNNSNPGKNAISLSIQNAINENNPNSQMEQSINKFQNYPNNMDRRREIISNSQNCLDDQDDNKSTFSFASKFDRVKDYFSNKENRDFWLTILQLVVVGIILFVVFRYCIRFSNSVGAKVKELGDKISNPGQTLREAIWALIKGIIVRVCWKYLHFTLILAIMAFIIYKYKARAEFNKICEQIIEDIRNDLKNRQPDRNGIRYITVKEIISKYSKKYNIDYKTFETIYYKKLQKLRPKQYSLKEGQVFTDEGLRLSVWFITD